MDVALTRSDTCSPLWVEGSGGNVGGVIGDQPADERRWTTRPAGQVLSHDAVRAWNIALETSSVTFKGQKHVRSRMENSMGDTCARRPLVRCTSKMRTSCSRWQTRVLVTLDWFEQFAVERRVGSCSNVCGSTARSRRCRSRRSIRRWMQSKSAAARDQPRSTREHALLLDAQRYARVRCVSHSSLGRVPPATCHRRHATGAVPAAVKMGQSPTLRRATNLR